VTPDNPITGDEGHEARWAGRSEYMKKVAWLWRNRAFGFAAGVLKATTIGPVLTTGSPAVSNRPLVEGVVLRETPEGYWQWYCVRKMPWGKCLRVNLGWKLWDHPSKSTFGQYVCAVSFTMGYTDGNEA
jgi:hypothetical protein